MSRAIFRKLTQACWLALTVLVMVTPSHAQNVQISEISVKACKEIAAEGKPVEVKVTITLKKTGEGKITYKVTDGKDTSKTLFEATSESAGDTSLEFSVDSADFSGTIHVEIRDADGNLLFKSDLVSVDYCPKPPENQGSDDPADPEDPPGGALSRTERFVTTATLFIAAGATLLASLAALIATIAGFAAARLVLSVTRRSRRETNSEHVE